MRGHGGEGALLTAALNNGINGAAVTCGMTQMINE